MRTATLSLPDARALRCCVVADTHSRPHPRLHEEIRVRDVDVILHAGDVGNERVVTELERVAPVIAVRGNIDGRQLWPDTALVDVVDGDRLALRILLLHIALRGPKLLAHVRRQAEQESATLVVCGHSHVPFIGGSDTLGVFNPGSCGPRRFTLPILFGMLTIARDGVTIEHIDCETGARWLPPV